MDSPVYNCKHRSRLEDISTSSSLDRSDINMMDLFETQPARNINRNNNAAKKTDTDSEHTSKSSIFTSASTSAQKPPETSGFFISAKSNSRIQVASSKANILNDIFGDLDNDTLAADLISTKIKSRSANSRPKFNSSSFQKPRTIQAIIPASKPVPNINKNINSVTSASNHSQHDSRINDSNDFSDEFDDDFAFITPTTISTNSTIATTDVEKNEKIEHKYEHRALSTQKMNLVEKYSKYTKQETKSKEISKPQDLPEKSELNDSNNSIDSDPPSPIITQTKHRISISSESENDASQEKINPTAFIVKQEPIDDSFSNPQDGAIPQPNPKPVGNFFSTASGSSVTISEEAKAKAAQGWNANQENKQSAACSGFFSTASGSTVSINDDALEKSKNLLRKSAELVRQNKSAGGPSGGFFSTARGGQVNIDANALAKSKGLFESSTDTITPVKSSGASSSGFFSTGRGGQVKIGANALAKSKGLFDNSADFTTPSKSSLASSGGFFATAKGGQVHIDAETLAKSKSLFQSSSADAQVKAQPKNVQSTTTPARPIRPYAGSMNLKRKSAFPEQAAELEETKKGRIEAEQQCIHLAQRNSYSNFANFKIDEDDCMQIHQNKLKKDLWDLIMPRAEFDMEEKAKLNEKLFQPLLQLSNQKESIQEQY